VSIAELAPLVAEAVGYKGSFRFNPDRPDGAPRKLLDTTKLTTLGWRPTIRLRDGLKDAYRWFLQNQPADAA
jgi:GDP-L-fucose synthase